MTEAWKVYIKGVPDRGNEVIKTLEDSGGSNPYLYHGDNNNVYYYINPDGVIDYASNDRSVAYPFLREFYKEIKLPRWKPKYKERYYRISWEGRVVDDTWTDTQDEEICYEFGNCFETYDKAKAASYKIQEILNK